MSGTWTTTISRRSWTDVLRVRSLAGVGAVLVACTRAPSHAPRDGGAVDSATHGRVGALSNVRIASVEIDGPFARDGAELLVHGRVEEVRTCNPHAAQGDLVVCARLDEQGAVWRTEVIRSPPEDPSIAACVQRRFGAWRVPPTGNDARSGLLRVVYAFGASDGSASRGLQCPELSGGAGEGTIGLGITGTLGRGARDTGP